MKTVSDADVSALIAEATSLLRKDPERSLRLVAELDLATIPVQLALDAYSVSSRAHIHLGNYELGEPLAAKAVRLAREHGLRVSEGLARNEAGVYCFVRGAFVDALNHYAVAEQLLRDQDEAGRGRVYVNIGNVYNLRGEYLQALIAYEQALDIARSVDDTLTQAKVFSNLSGLYRTALGSSDVAMEYANEAALIYNAMGDKVGLAKCLVNQGGHWIKNQQYAEAEHCFRQSLEIREAFSEPDDHIMTYDGLISALLNQGKVKEAEEVLTQAKQTMMQRPGVERASMFVRMAESRLLAANGQYAEAVEEAEAVLEFMTQYGQSELAAELQMQVAEMYLILGRYQESASLFRSLLETQNTESHLQASHRMAVIKAQMDRLRLGVQNDDDGMSSRGSIPTKERLQRAEANNEEFIAVLAHELKSPLHTMRSVMSLLANADAMSKEERQEYGREMQLLSTRMIDQISATLATAQGVASVQSPVVNARTVWEHVLSGASRGSLDKRINVTWEFDRGVYSIRTDEQMLVTIMENLVSNAVKFSGEDSSVHVTVTVPPSADGTERLLLEVVDDGPGLTKDDLSLMFRPFQTLSARPIGAEGSTGLGLYLVRRTVEILEGRVWGENRDAGAVFSVELPLATSAAGEG